MRVWRLSRERWADSAFTGQGASLFGGRWNHPGTSIVYTASSVALAGLETLVRVDRTEAPSDLILIPALLPDGIPIEEVDTATLPLGWRDDPSLPGPRDLGTAWALSLRTAVLSVPSAVVPHDRNYLLNPAHPDFLLIQTGSPEPFQFDSRLFRLLA